MAASPELHSTRFLYTRPLKVSLQILTEDGTLASHSLHSICLCIIPLQMPSLASDPEHREYIFLRLRAETFESELQLERRLRSTGRELMPEEWHIYLERERQDIMDKVHQYEHMCNLRNETSVSPTIHPPISCTHITPLQCLHHDPHATVSEVGINHSTTHRCHCPTTCNSSGGHQDEYINDPALYTHTGKCTLPLTLHLHFLK